MYVCMRDECPRVGSRSSFDEAEIRSPVLVSPCDAPDETGCPGFVSASLGASDEAQIVSEFRHMAPGPGGGQSQHPVCLVAGRRPFACFVSLAPRRGGRQASLAVRVKAVWRLHVGTCELVFAPLLPLLLHGGARSRWK